MQKKFIFLLIFLLLIVLLLPFQQWGQVFKSQVVRDLEPQNLEDCQKLSENDANSCIKRFAIQKKRISWCREITKPSKQKECEVEVGLLE